MYSEQYRTSSIYIVVNTFLKYNTEFYLQNQLIEVLGILHVYIEQTDKQTCIHRTDRQTDMYTHRNIYTYK